MKQINNVEPEGGLQEKRIETDVESRKRRSPDSLSHLWLVDNGLIG